VGQVGSSEVSPIGRLLLVLSPCVPGKWQDSVPLPGHLSGSHLGQGLGDSQAYLGGL
jgi:hypothetical protein